jgi:hypothetical protein
MGIRLVAHQRLCGSYNGCARVTVNQGEVFECSPEVAESLQLRGLASEPRPIVAPEKLRERLAATVARIRAK